MKLFSSLIWRLECLPKEAIRFDFYLCSRNANWTLEYPRIHLIRWVHGALTYVVLKSWCAIPWTFFWQIRCRSLKIHVMDEIPIFQSMCHLGTSELSDAQSGMHRTLTGIQFFLIDIPLLHIHNFIVISLFNKNMHVLI